MPFVSPNGPTPQPSASPAVGDLPTISLLEDWKKDHRELNDEQRQQVGEYIRAIVIHSNTSTPDGDAVDLWVKFRSFYDGLQGRYAKTNREDVLKAMGKL